RALRPGRRRGSWARRHRWGAGDALVGAGAADARPQRSVRQLHRAIVAGALRAAGRERLRRRTMAGHLVWPAEPGLPGLERADARDLAIAELHGALVALLLRGA